MSSVNSAVRDYILRLRGFSPPVRQLLVFALFAGLGISVFGLLFNLYLKSLGYREDFIGLLTSVNGLATATTAIASGLISDRIGRQRMLVLGITCEGLSVFGRAFATDATTLLMLNVLAGVSLPLWMVSFNPFLIEHSQPEERVHLFSVATATWLATGFAGNSLGGLVPGLYASLTRAGVNSPQAYRAGLLAAVLLYVIAIGLAMAIREGERPFRRVVSRARLGPLPREMLGRVARLVAFMLCLGVSASMIFPFLNVFLKDGLGAPPTVVGAILAGNQLVGLAGTLSGPAIAARLGRVRAVSFLLLVMSVVVVGIGSIPSLPLVVGLMYIRMALVNAWWPSYDSFILDITPADLRATMVSLVSIPSGVAFNLAYAAGSTTAGLLIVRSGYPLPYAISGASYVLAGLIYFRGFAQVEAQAMGLVNRAADVAISK